MAGRHGRQVLDLTRRNSSRLTGAVVGAGTARRIWVKRAMRGPMDAVETVELMGRGSWATPIRRSWPVTIIAAERWHRRKPSSASSWTRDAAGQPAGLRRRLVGSRNGADRRRVSCASGGDPALPPDGHGPPRPAGRPRCRWGGGAYAKVLVPARSASATRSRSRAERTGGEAEGDQPGADGGPGEGGPPCGEPGDGGRARSGRRPGERAVVAVHVSRSSSGCLGVRVVGVRGCGHVADHRPASTSPTTRAYRQRARSPAGRSNAGQSPAGSV